MTAAKRKGSRSIKEIPATILEQLTKGELESANLIEWLAVNQIDLLTNILTQLGKLHYLEPVSKSVDILKKKTVNTINEAIGTALFELAYKDGDAIFLYQMANHHSDSVRCWAIFSVAKNTNLSLAQLLDGIQPFAADKHFGVREISWIALRPIIAQNLKESIMLLAKFIAHSDENIRRFAVEITRPRGVWCHHIETLKQNPHLAISILEPLKSDSAKYVRDSLGNWLNDASKTQPDFVKNTALKWLKESPTKETAYVIKKALRTIDKE